jgi:hypothetical protein
MAQASPGQVDSLPAVRRFGQHEHPGQLQDQPETAAHQLLVVGDEHADGRHPRIRVDLDDATGSPARTVNPLPTLGTVSSQPP